jgi:hypothetical protein
MPEYHATGHRLPAFDNVVWHRAGPEFPAVRREFLLEFAVMTGTLVSFHGWADFRRNVLRAYPRHESILSDFEIPKQVMDHTCASPSPGAAGSPPVRRRESAGAPIPSFSPKIQSRIPETRDTATAAANANNEAVGGPAGAHRSPPSCTRRPGPNQRPGTPMLLPGLQLRAHEQSGRGGSRRKCNMAERRS